MPHAIAAEHRSSRCEHIRPSPAERVGSLSNIFVSWSSGKRSSLHRARRISVSPKTSLPAASQSAPEFDAACRGRDGARTGVSHGAPFLSSAAHFLAIVRRPEDNQPQTQPAYSIYLGTFAAAHNFACRQVLLLLALPRAGLSAVRDTATGRREVVTAHVAEVTVC